MTLVVLGLDAVDAAQVEQFDVDEFRLDVHGEMDTFAHQNPIPFTGEVWPSVATGLHPREHGVTQGGQSEWDNPVIELGSRIASPLLSMPMRARLGRLVRGTTGADWEMAEPDDPTIFDGEGRFVHNWPATANGTEFTRVWREIDNTIEAGEPQEEFDRKLWGIAAEKFGWMREMLDHDAVMVASHIHVLDAAGHAYGRNEEHYRGFYEKAARYVSEIREAMDEDDDMLILSDHGMNTTSLVNDHELCHHSWRAFSASTLDTRPESVFDVKDWVDEHVDPHERRYDRTETNLELPEQQLRDLGYIE